MSIHTTPNYGFSYYDQYDIGWHSGINNNFINLDSLLANDEKIAHKGAANGYAPLDGSSLVPLANIPATLTGKDADTVDGKHAADLCPIQATMWHDQSTILVGQALENDASSSQRYATYSYQTVGVNGDTFSQSFLLSAGTYTLYLLGRQNTNCGKIDWYVDNVLQISDQDWYAASNTANVVLSGSITVVGNGLHTLKGVVNGKNASSTGYQIVLTKLWIK